MVEQYLTGDREGMWEATLSGTDRRIRSRARYQNRIATAADCPRVEGVEPVARAGPGDYHEPAMQTVGRLLQIVGLVLLPGAMVVQLAGGIRPAQLLIALVFGAAVFYLGRVIEGYARRESSSGKPPRKKR